MVDLTDQLHDPVDVLFGTQLGGGTDINRALAYCQGLIARPRETIFVLISDLYEGGVREEMLRRVAAMTAAGVQVIVLLALSDEGAPAYDHEQRRRARRARAAGVRLHARRVPRPDGRRHRAAVTCPARVDQADGCHQPATVRPVSLSWIRCMQSDD